MHSVVALLKVNIIIWISENQELQRNPMKSSESRTNECESFRSKVVSIEGRFDR